MTERVALDMDPTTTYQAVGFSPTWNGWEVPYLQLAELLKLAWAADLAVHVDPHGTVTVWRTFPPTDTADEVCYVDAVLAPTGPDGSYLADLGLTLVRVG